ncbi:MAG: SpoIID/LytB domain-containing protein [Armatimonadetes bacterium]|nr:SpoIID/LytB domain-containing protein [Armatimonadota bacterium]
MRALAGTLLFLLIGAGAAFGVDPVPARAASQEIRVLLEENPSHGTISAEGGLWIMLPDGSYLPASRLELAPGSLVVDGTGRLELTEDLTVAPLQGLVTWNGRPYRGTLCLVRGDQGLSLINRVELEDYVRGVVPCELLSSSLEAVKAQAVLARTYALAQSRPGRSYDLTDTTRHQAYEGAAREHPDSDRAVLETEGEVLAYEGRLARHVVYHSTCGGLTEANEHAFQGAPVPYLRATLCGRAFEDPPFCSRSSYATWAGRRALSRVEQDLAPLFGNRRPSVQAIRISSRSDSGRVLTVAVETDEGVLEFGGEQLRSVLKIEDEHRRERFLWSTWFEIQTVDDGAGPVLLVAGRGWGHGVGMCQWGAMEMARQGAGYRQILSHYYRGTELAAWNELSGREK